MFFVIIHNYYIINGSNEDCFLFSRIDIHEPTRHLPVHSQTCEMMTSKILIACLQLFVFNELGEVYILSQQNMITKVLKYTVRYCKEKREAVQFVGVI